MKGLPMLPRLVPVTDMKRQAAKVLDALRQDRSPMVITEHGRAAAVLMDVATYEALTRRSEILEGIERGEKDFAEGRTASWEEVKSDLAKWRS
jgi:prevent-host-death family protein